MACGSVSVDKPQPAVDAKKSISTRAAAPTMVSIFVNGDMDRDFKILGFSGFVETTNVQRVFKKNKNTYTYSNNCRTFASSYQYINTL
jgi:hypothetical protein